MLGSIRGNDAEFFRIAGKVPMPDFSGLRNEDISPGLALDNQSLYDLQSEDLDDVTPSSSEPVSPVAAMAPTLEVDEIHEK